MREKVIIAIGENKMANLSEAARQKKVAYNVQRIREKVSRYYVSYTKGQDDDIIKFLETKKPFSTYVKELIKADYEKNKGDK